MKKKKLLLQRSCPSSEVRTFFFSHRTAGECREKKNTNGDMKRRSMIHLPTRTHKISFENMNRKRCAPSLWLRFRIMMIGSTIRNLLKQFLVLDAYSCYYPRDCICLKVRTSQKKIEEAKPANWKRPFLLAEMPFWVYSWRPSVCKLYSRL